MIHARKILTSAALFCALLALTPQSLARDVLSLVPKDALGFVVVNDLTKTSAKAHALTTKLKAPLPPLLTMLKMQSGIQEGLDESGDLLLAFLPGAERLDQSKPLLALPVSDYEKLITQIGGNASDEITEVTIAEKPFLVAKIDDFAVLVDSESKAILSALLESDATVSDSVKPLQEWAKTQDFALVALPEAINRGVGEGIKGLEEAQNSLPSDAAGPSVVEALNIYIKMLKLVRDDVQSAAVGLSASDEGNLGLVARVHLSPGGKIAQITNDEDFKLNRPLQDVPAGDFVFAGSNTWSPKLIDAYTKWSLSIMKSSGAMYGWDKLSDEDRKRMMEDSAALMKDAESMSYFMGVGEEMDPIYSNIFFVQRVKDSDQFIKSYLKLIERWNTMMEANEKAAMMKYGIEEIKIGDKQALKLTMDMNAVMSAQLKDNPDAQMAIQQMMGMMFGPEGQLTIMFMPISKEVVLGGICSQEQLERAAKLYESDKRLGDNSHVATTAALLPKTACAVGYLNPKATVAWVSRIISQVAPFAPFGQLPEFADCPPVGFATDASGDNIDFHLVLPKETIDSITKYIEQLQDR